MCPDHDLIVIGGGVAGLACAMAARRRGMDVLVVERSGLEDWRAGEHLAPGASVHFNKLGCASLLHARENARCPGTTSVWGSGEPDHKSYLLDPHGEGFNLSRPTFDRAFADAARSAGVRLVLDSKLTGISKSDGSWVAHIAGKCGTTSPTAAVVADATGRPASLARRLGAHRRRYDNLVGLVGRTAPVDNPDMSVTIEAIDHGWWYAVGMADGSVVATFMTDGDCADLSPGGRSRAWRTALRKSTLTKSRHHALEACEDLAVRSAASGHLDRMAGDGWLAVGDAAFSVDPLSSQGIAKAMTWGLKAAGAVADHSSGDAEALASYHRQAGQEFADYLLMRYRYYAIERRWPDAPFWSRRHEAPRPLEHRPGGNGRDLQIRCT